MPPVAARHDVPPRFWEWARWRLGRGEFKRYGAASPKHRPRGLPSPIPPKWRYEFDRRFPPRPKPPPAGRLRRPAPLWTSTNATYVNLPRNAPAAELADLMGGRYGHAIVVLGLLDRDDPTIDHDYVRDVWAPGLRARGKKVGGAQWVECDDVEAEADYAARKIRELGLDSWTFNGEKPCEGGGRSGRLVIAARRRLGPDFPLLWTPEPRLDLDHEIFRQQGVAIGPQAYPLENKFDLLACVQVAAAQGYDPGIDVVPLVDVREGYPLTEYAVEAHATGVRTIILYPGDAAFGRPQAWIDAAP